MTLLAGRDYVACIARAAASFGPDAVCAPFVRLQICVRVGGLNARIIQAQGGEQSDPLMPALFALAFSPALRDLHADLRSDEQALAGLFSA